MTEFLVSGKFLIVKRPQISKIKIFQRKTQKSGKKQKTKGKKTQVLLNIRNFKKKRKKKRICVFLPLLPIPFRSWIDQRGWQAGCHTCGGGDAHAGEDPCQEVRGVCGPLADLGRVGGLCHEVRPRDLQSHGHEAKATITSLGRKQGCRTPLERQTSNNVQPKVV